MLNLEALQELADSHRPDLSSRVAAFDVGSVRFDGNTAPALMGVINLSADSWYRESVCLSVDAAVCRGRVLFAQGASIVDIGAESTLAHAARVGESDQKSALIPVVQQLAEGGGIVSVETYHPSVTQAALKAGAKVLNLTGTNRDPEIFPLVADHEAAVILCYVQGANVREVANFDFSGDTVSVMYEQFARQIDAATRAGVRRIWIDPGLGFYYKNLQDSSVRIRHQMRVFLNSFRLRRLGWPVCHALPHAFEKFGDEVRSAEGFFAVMAALGKTDLFRTHEVPRVRAVLETLRVF